MFSAVGRTPASVWGFHPRPKPEICDLRRQLSPGYRLRSLNDIWHVGELNVNQEQADFAARQRGAM